MRSLVLAKQASIPQGNLFVFKVERVGITKVLLLLLLVVCKLEVVAGHLLEQNRVAFITLQDFKKLLFCNNMLLIEMVVFES